MKADCPLVLLKSNRGIPKQDQDPMFLRRFSCKFSSAAPPPGATLATPRRPMSEKRIVSNEAAYGGMLQTCRRSEELMDTLVQSGGTKEGMRESGPHLRFWRGVRETISRVVFEGVSIAMRAESGEMNEWICKS
jgi:hypothetical protein